MDKLLTDKDKIQQESGAQAASGPSAPADFSKKTVGAYDPALSAQAWDKASERGEPLKDSPKGRAVIRLFSRGVLGATGFAVGGWWATKRMSGYAPHLTPQNEVQYIAKFFDTAFGKPIKGAVNILGGNGEKFVNNFRPTAQFLNYAQKGRSLGHEVVMVTFDFASMALCDFWGRKIIHTLDPNKEPPVWKREDGSIDWNLALKTFGKNWWQAITYAEGEDWAVAVPYCLTMRHLGTPAIDKMFPGYRFEFDRNGNGGGMLINEAGKVTGNMTKAGILNLWERFTTYNIGTLMYREAYHWVGKRVRHAVEKKEMPALVEKDPANPNRSTIDTMTDGARQFANWIVRSTSKAVMYMIPAVTFFWITRTPQHKFEGRFIHPEKGMVMIDDLTPLRTNSPKSAYEGKQLFFSESREAVPNPLAQGADPNARTWGIVDTLMNPIAKLNDRVRNRLRGPIGKGYQKILKVSEMEGGSRADAYINAAIAYTPYFWAKSDWLADKWDTGRMDAAVDRTLAGAVHLNPSEFRAGLGEIRLSLGKKTFPDPVREEYAQCRVASDDSPSDNKFDINPVEGGNCDKILSDSKHPSFAGRVEKKDISPAAIEKAQPKIGFRERMIHGGKKTEVISPRGVSHAEAEEMRKALEEFNPPTNSIN